MLDPCQNLKLCFISYNFLLISSVDPALTSVSLGPYSEHQCTLTALPGGGGLAPLFQNLQVECFFLGGRESDMVLLNIFSLHIIFHKILL